MTTNRHYHCCLNKRYQFNSRFTSEQNPRSGHVRNTQWCLANPVVSSHHTFSHIMDACVCVYSWGATVGRMYKLGASTSVRHICQIRKCMRTERLNLINDDFGIRYMHNLRVSWIDKTTKRCCAVFLCAFGKRDFDHENNKSNDHITTHVVHSVTNARLDTLRRTFRNAHEQMQCEDVGVCWF